MFKLSKEQKTQLINAGVSDSDIAKIEEAGMQIVKRNLNVYSWIIISGIGLIVGIIFGKLF